MYVVVKFDKGRKLIRADYQEGAYIDLSFGTEGNHPTEVINVYDYEKGESEIETALEALGLSDPKSIARARTQRSLVREAVKTWIAEQKEEWPEFYEGYLENARYS